MNDVNSTLIQPFDLDGATPEEREVFALDLGDIIMKKVLKKAWSELDITKREQLTVLLEQSEAEPESEEKTQAVFDFLQTNIVNLSEFIAHELEAIQATYRQTRDQMLDAQS